MKEIFCLAIMLCMVSCQTNERKSEYLSKQEFKDSLKNMYHNLLHEQDFSWRIDSSYIKIDSIIEVSHSKAIEFYMNQNKESLANMKRLKDKNKNIHLEKQIKELILKLEKSIDSLNGIKNKNPQTLNHYMFNIDMYMKSKDGDTLKTKNSNILHKNLKGFKFPEINSKNIRKH